MRRLDFIKTTGLALAGIAIGVPIAADAPRALNIDPHSHSLSTLRIRNVVEIRYSSPGGVLSWCYVSKDEESIAVYGRRLLVIDTTGDPHFGGSVRRHGGSLDAARELAKSMLDEYAWPVPQRPSLSHG